MKSALVAVCCLTMAACAFLSVSYIVLKGMDDLAPLFPLALFAAQGAATVTALSLEGAAALDWLVLAGAVAILWSGGAAIRSTFTDPHFEGYKLLLGAMLIVQGVLTMAIFLRRAAPSAPSFPPAGSR